MYDPDKLPDPAVFGLRTPQPPRLCSLDDCDKPHHSDGYCRTHGDRLKATGDPRKVRPAGRHRVGTPGRTIPATADRGPRAATAHERIVLAAGQRELVTAEAARLATSGNQIIRAAVTRLIAGDIPLPAKAADIPDAATEAGGRWSWIPGTDQVEGVHRLAGRRRRVLGAHLDRQPLRTGPTPPLEAQHLSALVRYAVARHLNTTED